MRTTTTKRVVMTALGAFALVGLIAVAGKIAAGSTPTTTYSACVSKVGGALYDFMANGTPKCQTDKLITWNQAGLPGPAGPTGPTGAKGSDGKGILTGLSAPVGKCVAGDTYIDLATGSGEVYRCAGRSWLDTGNDILGPTGQSGVPGAPGLTGNTGASGAPGPAGASGLPGPAGASGLPGPAGASGLPGHAGASGLPGPAGATGPRGATGSAGLRGATGPPGPTGAGGMRSGTIYEAQQTSGSEQFSDGSSDSTLVSCPDDKLVVSGNAYLSNDGVDDGALVPLVFQATSDGQWSTSAEIQFGQYVSLEASNGALDVSWDMVCADVSGVEGG